MEQQINHMYEMHRFLQNLATVSRPRVPVKHEVSLVKSANDFISSQKNPLAPFLSGEESTLALNLGLSMPPLAHWK
jgi:hypothetical protein